MVELFTDSRLHVTAAVAVEDALLERSVDGNDTVVNREFLNPELGLVGIEQTGGNLHVDVVERNLVHCRRLGDARRHLDNGIVARDGAGVDGGTACR